MFQWYWSSIGTIDNQNSGSGADRLWRMELLSELIITLKDHYDQKLFFSQQSDIPQAGQSEGSHIGPGRKQLWGHLPLLPLRDHQTFSDVRYDFNSYDHIMRHDWYEYNMLVFFGYIWWSSLSDMTWLWLHLQKDSKKYLLSQFLWIVTDMELCIHPCRNNTTKYKFRFCHCPGPGLLVLGGDIRIS